MAISCGVQGLFPYFLFLGHVILELHKMRKRYGTSDDQFFHTESLTVEVSLIEFFVADFFGDRTFVETLYWFCALATALSNIQQSELKDINNSTLLSKKDSK